MKICKNCGELNTSDSQFCSNCGSTALVFKEEIACPNCGATNDSASLHCIACGAELNHVAQSVVGLENGQSLLNGETPLDNANDIQSVSKSTIIPMAETASCPNCGAQVAITEIYCSHCGANVASLHQHRVVSRKICPVCGTPNDINSKYCSYCYAGLSEAKIEDFQVVRDSVAVDDTSVELTRLEGLDGKKSVCPNCGALNEVDELFCQNCGLKIVVEDTRKYCPNCGVENPVDSKFCVNCQWSFVGNAPDTVEKWKCDKCGSLNDKEDLFCSNCGMQHNGGTQ